MPVGLTAQDENAKRKEKRLRDREGERGKGGGGGEHCKQAKPPSGLYGPCEPL